MIKLESINRAEALRYMACKDESTINAAAAACLDECEQQLLEVIAPKMLYRSFPILRENGIIRLQGANLELTGNDIAAHLEGCSHAVLIAATVGHGADRLIRTLQIRDMAKAVIADAFAGAAAEQIMNEAESIIRKEHEGKFLTWRYSPGYGDFPLAIQKKLLDVLDAPRKIGLCTSESCMLTPVKSVTAIIGVSDAPLPPKARGCVTCSMRDVCQFRKRGNHCGF